MGEARQRGLREIDEVLAEMDDAPSAKAGLDPEKIYRRWNVQRRTQLG